MAFGTTIILSTGSNDDGQISRKQTTENVANTVSSLGQNKNVVLIAPGPALSKGLDSVNGAVYAGANNSKVISIPINYYESDGIHPTRAGYDFAVNEAKRLYPDTQYVGVGDSVAVGINQSLGLQTESNDINSKYNDVLYAQRGISSKAILNNTENINGKNLTTANSENVKNSAPDKSPEEKTQKAQQDLNTSLNNAFLNSYNVKEEDIAELEKQTNLTSNEDNKKGLGLIYKKFSANLNMNRKYLLLSMLVYGFDYKVLTANLNPKQNECTIDDNFIKNFQDLIKDEDLVKYIKQTPAYSKGCFDGYGAYGATAITGDSHQSNPMTGAARHQPSLTEKLLNSIHPDAYKNIESFCNKIRTRSWLALPKNGFGSLSKIVHGIQASIAAFQEMIADIYQGCIEVIQQVYAYLNGIMVAVQKKIISIINDIIPLDFICLILDTLQVLMDDINFFTSLFQMSGPFLNYLNNFQSFLNSASQFVSNPLSTIQAYLPEEVNNIINLVNQIGADPNGFIADQLNNYGYGYVLNALQGNLVGAISNKYGPQYAAITPLGNILTKATAVYSRFGGQFPATPATLGPNIFTGPQGMSVDVNGNPVRLKSVSSSDISDVSKTTRNLGNNIGSIIGNVGENLKTNASRIGAGLEEAGEGFKGLPSDVSNFFGGIGNTVKKVTGTGGQ